ncbi:M23 family metallopeptidase [Schaalia sp. Marseille-Q2122]|uniref:M23 family metallopeptidase n=1 Tax=Schaalia sp. Marseille-Q2122 TaxID=2736604 RepID=UPI0020CA9B54|nr:M23 family metallopeptidase [Schaalia sp. Marseille-Q2122]
MTHGMQGEYPFPSRTQLHGRSRTTVTAADNPYSSLLAPESETLPTQSRSHSSQEHAALPRSMRQVIKASALALLTLTTVVVPVAGFIGPDSSVQLPVKILSSGTGGHTWVGTVNSSIEYASLEGAVAAASRTRVRTPLLATACVPAETAANGDRVVVKQERVYWPLKPGTYEITSGFSMRISPVSGQMLMHEGVDMAASLGTPMYSAAAGVVTEVAENSRSGAYVVIRHEGQDGTPYFSAYLHQYMNDIVVTQGQEVDAGQLIGAVGNNGWSTGAHLHFEIRDAADKPIDPVPFMEEAGATFLGQECQ